MATSKATADKIIEACIAAAEEVRALIPYDTGNMSKNSFQYRITDTGFVIYMDESQAPYMPITNEPWDMKIIKMGNFRKGEVVQRLRTWRNPNEGWWDKKLVPAFARSLAARLGGTVR